MIYYYSSLTNKRVVVTNEVTITMIQVNILNANVNMNIKKWFISDT